MKKKLHCYNRYCKNRDFSLVQAIVQPFMVF